MTLCHENLLVLACALWICSCTERVHIISPMTKSVHEASLFTFQSTDRVFGGNRSHQLVSGTNSFEKLCNSGFWRTEKLSASTGDIILSNYVDCYASWDTKVNLKISFSLIGTTKTHVLHKGLSTNNCVTLSISKADNYFQFFWSLTYLDPMDSEAQSGLIFFLNHPFISLPSTQQSFCDQKPKYQI